MQSDRLFVILWQPGPAWIAGKPITEQTLDGHRQYFADLHRGGSLILAGPFMDATSGGLAILRARDHEAAEKTFQRDPAIVDGIFVGEVRPFHAVFDQTLLATSE